MNNKITNTNNRFAKISKLIEEARQNIAVAFNATTTILAWNIGR